MKVTPPVTDISSSHAVLWCLVGDVGDARPVVDDDLDVHVRYSVAGATPTARRIFTKSRDYLVTPATGTVSRFGTITGDGVRIYRIHVVDTLNEVLVYTSDGTAACD